MSDLAAAESALRKGNYARARRLLQRVLLESPLDVQANELMAHIAMLASDIDRATKFMATSTLSPLASATTWHRLGVLRWRQGLAESAIAAFEQALSIDTDHVSSLRSLGRLYLDLHRLQQSCGHLQKAVRLDPTSIETWCNLARALQGLGHLDAALDAYDQAIRLNPRSAELHSNRGEILSDLKKYDQSLAAFAAALELNPNLADVHWNEALVRLTMGQLEIGWRKYEYRWAGRMASDCRHRELPSWSDGHSLHTARLLIWWEQGLGDTLHFCRYIPLLLAEGAHIVFEVQPELKTLMQRSLRCEVTSAYHPAIGCTHQIPLLSLPLLFRTTLADIPACVPYLQPDYAKVEEWRTRLGLSRPQTKVGITCSGNPKQKDNKARSIPIRHFACLEPYANMYLIQVGVSEEDRAWLKHSGSRIRLVEGLRDFDDTAAIIESMDLVISVDTAVAHLSAALAKPTWILLPWTPTWRWMVDRADSPWYPTVKLIRQSELGRWNLDGLVKLLPETSVSRQSSEMHCSSSAG